MYLPYPKVRLEIDQVNLGVLKIRYRYVGR